MKRDDRQSLILLILLYMLQGVPIGLSFGSVPFLLKDKLGYSELAIFSLATYPYSLKLLWSPIVDSVYIKSFGRRKSWIFPIQLLTGLLFLWLGVHIESLMQGLEHTDSLYYLSAIFFVMVFLSATQDIAVDGWALTLLSAENVSYSSTAQSIGITLGYFMSFTIFLAFNSAEFCNKYLLSVPQEHGILSLSSYLTFWGYVYLIITFILLIKKEASPLLEGEPMNLREAYATMWSLLTLPHLQLFATILLVAKIGFVTNDAVTGLKLLEKGFSKEDLALAVLIDVPMQIVFGYLAAAWSKGNRPLRPWRYAFLGRLACAFLAMIVVNAYPKHMTNTYFFSVIGLTVLSSFMNTVMFVSISAFISTIADPSIGGTYMTFLNTLSNFGGTWPRFFVLEAVAYFSESKCIIDGLERLGHGCSSEQSKHECERAQGTCVFERDGYYTVNTAMILAGLLCFTVYIYHNTRKLELVPLENWRLTVKIGKKD